MFWGLSATYRKPQKGLIYTSKGSFCSRKKIVKVSFPGVAVWGSCGVEDLRCGGVAQGNAVATNTRF